ncbi:MAG: prepilin-type N-terminal cleavage/methylation domain-containing protein [Anaerolineae bacterium]|nr:prepilin-type N-terminal cleavage/methylation domain-containing protein [Gloeobacterales cyanobacterium ES-bin-313]
MARNRRGLSLIETMVAVAILASIGGLTSLVINALQAPSLAKIQRQYAIFITGFDNSANRATAKNFGNLAFSASSLAQDYPLNPESSLIVSVSFQGCIASSSLLQFNTLATADLNALTTESTAQTPAEAISNGTGKTGGVMINEFYNRTLGADTTIFAYLITGPTGTQPHTSYIVGEASQCK